MKKIQDYIHYYLGAKMVLEKQNKVVVVNGFRILPTHLIVYTDSDLMPRRYFDSCKLILRPMNSMTTEERIKSMIGTVHENMILFETFNYLVKNGFDIFDLHKDGLCVYESELVS